VDKCFTKLNVPMPNNIHIKLSDGNEKEVP